MVTRYFFAAGGQFERYTCLVRALSGGRERIFLYDNSHYTSQAGNEFINKLQQVLKIEISVSTSVTNYITSERSFKFQLVKGLVKNV